MIRKSTANGSVFTTAPNTAKCRRPKRETRPQSKELNEFLKGLGKEIVAKELDYQKKLGRTTVRRMTRFEYENTLKDLLDLPTLSVKGMFPEDGTLAGYDKVSQALDISHVHMDSYLKAAEKALRQATADIPKAPPSSSKRYMPHAVGSAWVATRTFGGIPILDGKIAPGYEIKRVGKPPGGYSVAAFDRKLKADSYIMLNRGGGVHGSGISFQKKFVKHAGYYKFKFSTWGLRWEKGKILPAVKGVVSVDDKNPKRDWTENVRHYGDKEFTHTLSILINKVPTFYFDAPSLKPTEHEFTVWLEPRDTVSFMANSLYEKGPANWQSVNGAMSYKGPGIAIDWFDVEGPVNPVWPPAAHTKLWDDCDIVDFKTLKNKPEFVSSKFTVTTENPSAKARQLLSRFAEEAFRRPLKSGEIDYFVSIAENRMTKKESFQDAMIEAYKAVLTSPDFLFLGMEPEDYKVASKLSYFLWGSKPDDELLKLASQGKLSSPDVLKAQADRLMKHEKSRRFVENFTDQWIDLRDIDATSPDKTLYPEFDPWLRDSMLAETRSFFRKMLTENRPVTNLVDSDTVEINQRLAEHYGIKGIYGNDIREVKVPEGSNRGGILTQASVMKVSANGTVTSPIVRGIWVSEKILGIHPPPPPANVPAIDPSTEGATTIREQLEKHREHPSCAGCHAKLDPPGLAMESFDVIGGWRENYRATKKGQKAEGYISSKGGKARFKIGLPVDPSGELNGGAKFAGFQDFRKLLLEDKKQLKKNMLQQLMIYATGRKVSFADRREITRLLGTKEYGLRDLIHQVIQSPLFKL